MKFVELISIPLLSAYVYAQSFCSNAKHSGTSIKETSNKVGSINGIGYELWADGGSNSATFYSDGSFSCSFNNSKDYLCRTGLSFDSTKTHSQIGHIYADFKLVKQNIRNVDYSYVGIYGWTRSPLVEWYIVDNWLSQYRPGDWVGNKKHGNFQIDGATYTVYENTRYGPSIDGNTNFKQFFSIRQNARDCGTIDITAHFQQWEKLGMQLGKMHEAKVLGEAGSNGGGTSGTADFPYAKVYIGNGNGGGNNNQQQQQNNNNQWGQQQQNNNNQWGQQNNNNQWGQQNNNNQWGQQNNNNNNNNNSVSNSGATGNGKWEYLKSYSNGFRIGTAANTMRFNNNNYIEGLKAFNYMVAENGCKLSGIQQSKGVYNFNDCDSHYNKAKELGMAFRGHALIWHAYMPNWFQNADATTLKNAIVDHITKVLQHYDGKIDTWDVVNEAIDDSSNGNGWKMRNSFLYQKVPDFVDLSFKTAAQVAPNVKRFYNDYNTEGIYGKTESVFQFVKDMKSRGIPIDGVGIQYHVSVASQPQYSKINDLISRYCALGLEVHITELDVKCDNACNSGNIESQQATVFTNALKACLANKCCTAYLVWGVGDPDSWLGSDKKGLLFNSNYQPKSQYTAVLNVLKTTKAASLSNTNNNQQQQQQNNNQQQQQQQNNNQQQQQQQNNNQQQQQNQWSNQQQNQWSNQQQTVNRCSARIVAQGYRCCASTCVTVYTDDDGNWGVENDQWCGCANPPSNTSCVGAQGYPCCQSSRMIYFQDGDGNWSIENGDWCIIRN